MMRALLVATCTLAGCTLIVGTDSRQLAEDAAVPPDGQAPRDAGASDPCDTTACWQAEVACKSSCVAAYTSCLASCENSDEEKNCPSTCSKHQGQCNDACVSACSACTHGCGPPCSK